MKIYFSYIFSINDYKKLKEMFFFKCFKAKSNNQDSNSYNLKLPFDESKKFSNTKSTPSTTLNTPKSNFQAQVYNFLERPTGWKCKNLLIF